MENEKILITGLKIVDAAPYATGEQLLAFFDANVRGFTLKECTLLMSSRGFPISQPARGTRRGDGTRLISIDEHELRCAVTAAAWKAYEALRNV